RDKLVTGVQTCALPIWPAVEVDADEIAGAEEGVDALAVGRRRRHRHAARRELAVGERRAEEAGVPPLLAVVAIQAEQVQPIVPRSEERRVGKECRLRR